MQPSEHGFAGKTRPNMQPRITDAKHTHRADTVETCQCQPTSNEDRGFVFAMFARADGHRCGRIDQQIRRESPRGFKLFDVVFACAGGDTPVDRFHRIARGVQPRLHIFQPWTECRRSVRTETQTIREASHGNVELPRIEVLVAGDVSVQGNPHSNSRPEPCATAVSAVRIDGAFGYVARPTRPWHTPFQRPLTP